MSGLSEEAKQLVRVARNNTELSVTAKARVLGSLHAKIAAGGMPAATTLYYLLLGVAGAGAIIGFGAWWWNRDVERIEPTMQPVVVRDSPPIVAEEIAAMPEPMRVVQELPPAEERAATTVQRRRPRRRASEEAVLSEPAPIVEQATPEIVVAEPTAPPERQQSSLAEETGLLRAAQRALADGTLQDARASLDEHARRFPQGLLALERDATRWVALCMSGATPTVTRGARHFLRLHPRSMHEQRIRRACNLDGE